MRLTKQKEARKKLKIVVTEDNMQYSIICLGKLKEDYLQKASAEYEKRISGFCKINIIELTPIKINENPSENEINQALKKEAQLIRDKLPKNSYIISLCIEGKCFDSNSLSDKLLDAASSGKSDICFIIGSSHGLSEDIKHISDLKLSMSAMTFPHQLARVMLLEQIYRSFAIQNNKKYHK